MTRSPLCCGAAVILVVLAIGVRASAQGKSQDSHGNNGKGNSGNGKGAGSSSSSGKTPSTSLMPAPTSISSPSGAAPFAWMDSASLMEPGVAWVGLSIVHWSGGGFTEVSVPVIDAALGIAPRLQLGASIPRVADNGDSAGTGGGLGTAFMNAKIGILRGGWHGLNVAIAPTLEILSGAALQFAPIDSSRAQWGLPVSMDVERGPKRIYASGGYFSPGVWFGGVGAGTQVSRRINVAASLSHAWRTSELTDPVVDGPSRNDFSGGVSIDLTNHLGVFGSLGRTIATTIENGAGTTVVIGCSWTGRSTRLSVSR
jgi:hypothetical protein